MSKDQKNLAEKTPLSAAAFMKKQAAQKAVKAKDMKALKQSKIDDKANEEAEVLDRAKKESRAVAADYNKSEMIKRLVLENIVRYAALMILLICTALASIKIIPSFITFIYQAIRSFFTI